MNTIPLSPIAQNDADRIATDTAMLKRVADLTLHVIELTAQQISQEQSAPNPETAAEPEKTSNPKPPDHRPLFDRLVRSFTAIMALKTRIATSRTPHPNWHPTVPGTDPLPDADCRRLDISAYLHDAIENMPHPKPIRADLHHQVEHRIDAHLADDPELKRAGGEIALDICEEFNIPFEMSRMCDELLVPPGRTVPNGWEDHLARQNNQSPIT